METNSNQELSGWSLFERTLIYQRYSVRDPKTGTRLEKTYEDVIDRITDYVLSLPLLAPSAFECH